MIEATHWCLLLAPALRSRLTCRLQPKISEIPEEIKAKQKEYTSPDKPIFEVCARPRALLSASIGRV